MTWRGTATIRAAALCVCLGALLAGSGCRLAQDLLPRTHTTSTSPDGRYYAFVRQHLNPDPPDDHLYIAARPGAPRHVMALAPDADWCRTILWTPDSRTVGFLINEQRLALFDVRRMALISTVTLVKADGYPGSEEARHVSIANDGMITFEHIVRPTMLLPTKAYGIIEAPVTRSGTYGRPIHTPARSLGFERITMARFSNCSEPSRQQNCSDTTALHK
jgi:hypothetical protein